MAFKYKELIKFAFFFFLIVLTCQNSFCFIEEEQIEIFQSSDKTTKNTLGEYCWKTKCSERQICNEMFKCECGHGFKNRSNVCMPLAGENEECLTSRDCNGMLFCINGMCRKATPNAEFITLAKICLGITIISIILALLSFLLKCLLRLDNSYTFGQCRNSQSTNSINTQGRQALVSEPPSIRIPEEKPPSYEECIRQGRRNSSAEPPPPYVISFHDFTTSKRNFVFPVRNVTEITSRNPITIPSVTQVLSQESFSNESFTQKTRSVQPP